MTTLSALDHCWHGFNSKEVDAAALAEILVTGKEPRFSGSSVEAMYHALKSDPVLNSSMADQHIPKALDQLIQNCQLRDVQQRPQSASEIMDTLQATALPSLWTEQDARAWWHRFPLSDDR